MKDMAAMQPGMSFYADMPDSYNLVVNTEHPLVQQIRDSAQKAIGESVEPLAETVEKSNSEITALRDAAGNDKQPDAEAQQKINDLEKSVAEARESQEKIVSEYAAGQPLIKQLIDLALLGNGLLRGQALSDFISRSVGLLK